MKKHQKVTEAKPFMRYVKGGFLLGTSLSVLVVAAQEGPSLSALLKKAEGLPSSVALARGQKQLTRSEQKSRRVLIAKADEENNDRQQKHEKLHRKQRLRIAKVIEPPAPPPPPVAVAPVAPATTDNPTQPGGGTTTVVVQPPPTPVRIATGPAKPTTGTTKPTTNPVKPSTGTTKPTTNSGKPAPNSGKPTTGSAKPITGTAKPTANSGKPAPTIKPDSGKPQPGGVATHGPLIANRLPNPVPPSPEPVPQPPIEKPAPPPEVETQVDIPSQNLTLTFVNPNKDPVKGLRVLIHTQEPEADEKTVAATPEDTPAAPLPTAKGKTYTTDEKGQVRLAGLPLPVAIDLDIPQEATATPINVQSSNAQSSSALRPTRNMPPQWSFADPKMATLILDEPRGEGKIQSSIARIIRSTSVSPRFASLRIPFFGLRGRTTTERVRIAKETVRQIIHDADYEPIELQRNVVDLEIAALPGSRLSSPILNEAALVTDVPPVVPENPKAETNNPVEANPAKNETNEAAEPKGDVPAPQLTSATTPAPGEEWKIPENGKLLVRLPLAALADGPVPIRVARTLTGGESEAVIQDYKVDSYALNHVEAPAMQLANLSAVELPPNLNVLTTRAAVVAAFKDLKGKENKPDKKTKIPPLGMVETLADGSEWWIYTPQGFAVRMRYVLGANPAKKDAAMIVESVRLLDAKAGALGGVHVGDALETLKTALGAPQAEKIKVLPSASMPAGTVDSYLDGGLRVCHDDTKILWLETARSNELLKTGTTAFVNRPQARLFIENFQGHPKTNLRDVTDLKNYLRQINSVRIVDSREDADLVFTGRVSEFYADKDDVTELLPYRFDCRVKLEYSLLDVATGKYIKQNETASGVTKVDYGKEAILLGVAGGVAAKKLGDWVYLLLGFGLVELNQAIRHAANRSPAICTRTAFGSMAADINEAADFSVRVTKIDYQTGRVTLNAGTRQGVRISTYNEPFDFQLNVGGAVLPAEDTPKLSDFYAARVVEASNDSCICEVRHITRKVSKAKEKLTDVAAPEVVRTIPDPSSGLVSARAWVQFPPVELITEEDVQRATTRQQTAADAAPADNNNNGKKGGGLLDGLFGK